jgi:membrane-associated phospholipid phosphatase
MVDEDKTAVDERLLAQPDGRRVWYGAGACLLLTVIALIGLDHHTLAWEASWFAENVRQAAKLLSNFIEMEAVAFCLLAAVGLWGATRFGMAAAVASLGGVGIGTVLKRVVGRVRPDGGGRAFPSTHAVAAFALAFVLA